MLADALALARAVAPTGSPQEPSLAQAEADRRSAARLREAAPLLGVSLGVVAFAILSARWRRDR